MEEKWFISDILGQEYDCTYIRNADRALRLISFFMEKDCLFGVDIETTPKPKFTHIPKAGLSPLLSDIRLLQITDGIETIVFDCRFIPFRIFIPFLSTKRLIAHNAVFEMGFFLANGVLPENLGCTMLLAKLIMHATYPTDAGLSSGLAALVKICFDVELPKALQISDFSVDELTFEQIQYAALDAIWCLKLGEKMAPGLAKLGMFNIYQITKDAQAPICALQNNGILLNVPYYRTLIDKWRDELYADKKKVMKVTGLTELTSHKLGSWLEVNLPKDILRVWPRTETEKLSTSADTFADFSFLDIVEPFSAFQKKEKLTSTYGNSLLSAINPRTSRLHASYKLLGARTGRLSSSAPNLQNLPRDPAIRKAFSPSKGYTFLCADYSQIELRVAAELSQDATMLEAYRKGIDLHSLTASRVARKPIDAVSKDDRQKAKAMNFGFLFGLGAKKFSHYAKKSYGAEVTQEQAFEAVEAFRDTYSGYREWQMAQAEIGATTMISKTPSGKVRKLSQENCYGASMNTPVQGGASEVMLRALTRLYKETDDDKIRLVNCVHDEILLEVLDEPEYIQAGKEIMEESMTKAYLDIFPNGITNGLVEVGVGKSWAEAKE